MYMIRRAIRFWWQRQWRGWDDSELWNIDTEMAAWLAPRLRRWLEIGPSGYPPDMEYQEWLAILEKMAVAMEHYANDTQTDADAEGLRLFEENWRHLWD